MPRRDESGTGLDRAAKVGCGVAALGMEREEKGVGSDGAVSEVGCCVRDAREESEAGC